MRLLRQGVQAKIGVTTGSAFAGVIGDTNVGAAEPQPVSSCSHPLFDFSTASSNINCWKTFDLAVVRFRVI